MAKKSQRRVVQYEKDKSGCMWGFISMLDFRHGHATRKLIADKRRSSKHAVGVVHSKNKFEMLSDLDEVYEANFDSGESKRPTMKSDVHKPSVKKLIEEEMFTNHNAMKVVDNSQVEESKESSFRHGVPLKVVDSKRKKKSSKKSRDMDTEDLNLDATLKSEFSHNQHSRKQSRDNLDLDKIIEEFCHKKGASSMMHNNESNQKQAISENIAREAIHEFVNKMMLNGKDLAEARKFLCSDELMETLQLISSDKELFLSLLQNPNSLLSKCVQEHSSITGSNFSEHDCGNLEQAKENVSHKKHNFFRKKVKSSQPKSSTHDKGNAEFSNRIVVLKPGNSLTSPLDSSDTAKHNGPSSVRGSSHFSLTEIKRKLKHAMGRERHGNLQEISKQYPAEYQNKRLNGKAIGTKENVGMRSPNKDHFFMEKIARPTTTGAPKGGKAGNTLKDSGSIVECENSSFPKQRVSNLYTEAKKHLSEMTGRGDENLSSRQISKTLGRILSLPEYNFSPLGSPSRDWEHHFVTAPRRLSPSDNLPPKPSTSSVGHLDQEANNPEKQSCDESSNNEVQEIKSDSNFSDNHNHVDTENCFTDREEIVTEGDVVVESAEENVLESSSDTVVLSTGKEDQSYDKPEMPESVGCSQCSMQDVTEESKPSSPPSSPSHTSVTRKVKELESGPDVPGRPSPVSVLDIPFLWDDVSPEYSRFQTVDVPVRPLNIEFEEHDLSPVNQIHRGKHCPEENELLYKYIKALLQASGLSIDQLPMKCLSSDKILEDPSLFDQVEFLSNQLCHDKKLLYDSVNDVLMEVCWCYFGVTPWVSFVNPSIVRPILSMRKVILKVLEGVCWHFNPVPPPRTLDKIVEKDMEKSGAWMELRFEVETVGFEMCEVILAELMEDTVLSCVSETLESKCEVGQ